MAPASDFKQGALFDLSSRGKFRVTGADRMRFLNGQVTNDVRKANATSAIQACVLNAKGKINGTAFISAEADFLLLDTEPELREPLLARLDRYIIADDVQIEDITKEFSIFHTTGETTPRPRQGARMVIVNRFGCAGWDVWTARSAYAIALQEFRSTYIFCEEAEAETFRIERGIPRWGRELSEEIIPIEANMESTAIDYAKGCYIGQEVISRIKMSGQTNKRLCGLTSLSDQPLTIGMRLATLGDEPKEVGSITSATRSPTAKNEIALGYVKRGFNIVGTRLKAFFPGESLSGGSVEVEVSPLPFS